MNQESFSPTPSNNRTLWIILAVVIGVACLVCICLAAGAGLFVINSSSTEIRTVDTPVAAVTRIRATATPADASQGVETTPVPSATTGPQGTPMPEATASGETPLVGSLTDTERQLESISVPQRDLRELAMQLRPGIGDIPPTVNPTPPAFKVGDVITFTVSNVDTNDHFVIDAELRYITPHVYMWVEQGAQVNQRDLQASADLFESKTYPTDREFFGSEWTPGVDNDVHLHILHARNLGSSVAGYYSSADEFSRKAQPYSNEKEMFYINLDNNEPGNDFYDGTLAHEFQHMIHWHNDRNEETWVNEGMSELASALNGFDPGGADRAFSANPDTQLNTWGDTIGDNAPHYGASYLFMTYFLEQFGEAMMREVVASPLNGIAGFNDVLARNNTGTTFDQVFAEWVVANILDQSRVSDPRFGYTEISPQPMNVEAAYRRYPAVEDGGKVWQYATDYFQLRGSGDVAVTFSGDTAVGLVNAKAHSGRFAWWSNRTDDSDATLTRSFDLSAVSKATLNFWTWYDLEKDFDYAYVEASTNGGTTWTILPGRYSTTDNPNGNSFGAAYTGTSGGTRASWVQDSIDLSAYAGQSVQVRFQYITDDAVNGPGMLIDDISVPEINYSSDAEADDGGWESQGWLRTDNQLRQRWLVQLVELTGNQAQVSSLAVGADGKGSIDVNGLGDNGKTAYLLVSALAPVTTEVATFDFEIRPR